MPGHRDVVEGLTPALRLQVTKSLAPLVGCKARCLFLTSVVLFLILMVLP